MSKPTLVQSLLNQPSKSYANADSNRRKDYYSTRQEMIRIAGQKTADSVDHTGGGQEGTNRYQYDRAGVKPSEKREPAMTKGTGPPMLLNHSRRPSSRILEPDEDSDSDVEADMFFTPNTSPRASMASSVATITFPSSGRRVSRKSLSSLRSADSSQAAANPSAETQTTADRVANVVPSTRTPSGNARNALSTASSLSSTSLDAHSIFSSDYTTVTTEYYVRDQTVPIGRGTPVRSTSTRTSSSSRPSKAGTYAHLGVSTPNGHPKSNGHPPSTKDREVTKHEAQAPPKSKGKEREIPRPLPDVKLDPSGKNSGTVKTNTAEPTPRQQQPYKPPKQPHTFSAFAPIDSTTTPKPPSSTAPRQQPPPNQSKPTSPSNATGPSSIPRPQSSTATSPSTRTNNRPANNVRHFSAPVPNRAPRQSPQPNPAPSVSSSSSNRTPRATVESPSPSPPPPPVTHQQQYPQRSRSSYQPDYVPAIPPMPTITPLIRGMDAVLEEDEDGPLTPRMEAQNLPRQSDGWDWTGASYSSSGTPPATSISAAGSSRLRHTTQRKARPRSVDSVSGSSTSSHSRSTPKTLTAEVNALVNSFADSEGALPSVGTQGYSSLVLPRAPPPVNGATKAHREKEGKVDLTRSGVAQMTMATVEVVRGLGASAGGGGVLGFLGLGRRRSLSTGKKKGPAPIPLRDPATGVPDSSRLTGLRYTEPTVVTPLGFTSYRPPPSYVPSSSVLVQVWAVGVDGVDGRLVGAKFGNHYLREGVSILGGDLELVEEPEDMEDELEDGHAAANGNGNGYGHGHVTDGDDDYEGDVPSTATVDTFTSPAKKGGLAALGRSISLRLSRGQSKKNKDLQRSSSAAATSGGGARGNPAISPPRQQAQSTANSRPSPARQSSIDPRTISHPKRSFSLKRRNTAASHVSNASSVASASPAKKDSPLKRTESVSTKKEKAYTPEVGYIPGRSFVGRVLECGWEVPDEAVKKGEWVVGLLDVRKGGALAEFIVVDRHRVHRVPHPRTMEDLSSPSSAKSAPVWTAAPMTVNGTPRAPTLTLEELALLPLSGLPAQRAVRTLDFAFSAMDNAAHAHMSTLHRPQYDFGNGMGSPTERRRALVLRGHDGAGAMAVQILVRRGWRVSVHVPYSLVPSGASKAALEETTRAMEDRAREWGADEVIFDDGEGLLDDGRGAAVRVLESIRADGDVFDAVVDPIGGKEVWEAAERLLKFPGVPPRRRGIGQFTTLVGDWPDRIIPRAKDHLRSGLRAMRMGSTDNAHEREEGGSGKVGYAWVSVAQDVDWEGDGVSETLGAVIRLALEDGVRPPVDDVPGQMGYKKRVVPFEQSPQAFVDNGLLGNGGTVVVKIAG